MPKLPSVVEPVDVKMAVLFALRMTMEAETGPKLPWRMDGDWITSATDDRIGKVIKLRDGSQITGMITGAAHVNSTLHRLCRLMVDAAQSGPGSNSAKRLNVIVRELMQMEAEGKLPQLG